MGGSCQTAHQLEANKLKGPSLPFDWVVTSFSSVHALIENDFADWMEKENLRLVQDDEVGWYVEERKYRIRLLHDLPLNLKYMQAYDAAKAKYERRIKRLLELLNSDKRVLLVRLDITRDQAQAFDEMLQWKFPLLSYDILALNSTDPREPDWGLARIKNLYLAQPDPPFWAGLDEPWRKILAGILHAPVAEPHAGTKLAARLEPREKHVALRRRETKNLAVRVVNESKIPLGFGSAMLGLSYHLLTGDGRLLQWDNERTMIPRVLQSGEAREIQVVIAAPAEAGSYQAELDLVWEGVTWLKEKGSPTSIVRLTVL